MKTQRTGHFDYESLAAECNRVKDFTEQQHDVEPGVLQLAGRIFIEHSAHQHFGLALLHRHRPLSPGFGMVHEQNAAGEDVCTMQSLLASKLFPHTIFLDSRETFIPLEYSKQQTVDPDATFLKSLRRFLRASNLQQLLGVTVIPEPHGTWLERGLAGGGTIAIRHDHKAASLEEVLAKDAVDTAWLFTPDGPGLKIEVLRKCKTDNSGGHIT